jgi:ABC-type Fe3+-hydroxamate transport system substrate-binding protein
MADTFSTSLEFRLQSVGGNNNTWGSLLNTTLSNIDAALGGVAQISLASADVTLSTAQNRNPVIEVTGTLPDDRDLVVKTQTKTFWIKNSTSGAYTVTVKTAAGTGVEVPQGEWRLVYCDGTNVETITGSLASYDSIVFGAAIDSDAITTDKRSECQRHV